MNWIKKIFFKKLETNTYVPSEYEIKTEIFIQNIINDLKENPDFWTTKWYFKNKSEKSIMNKDRTIQIMVESGDIIKPISYNTKHSKFYFEMISYTYEIKNRDVISIIESVKIN